VDIRKPGKNGLGTDEVQQREPRIKQHTNLQWRVSLFHGLVPLLGYFAEAQRYSCAPRTVCGRLMLFLRSGRLGPFRASAPTAWWRRAGDKSLKCSVSPSLRVCGSEEAVCCVVTQIDATELPDELFDIEIVTQVP